MATTTYRCQNPVLTNEIHEGDDVGNPATLDDESGVFVDHSIVYPTFFVVIRIIWANDVSIEAFDEFLHLFVSNLVGGSPSVVGASRWRW
jgi:hypothetical protein